MTEAARPSTAGDPPAADALAWVDAHRAGFGWSTRAWARPWRDFVREHLAARYLDALKGLPLVLPADAPAGGTHAWHLFVLRLSDGATVTRDELIQALSDAGIGTSVHYVPLHRQPYWQGRYGLRPEQFPQADKAYQRMFSIPLFTAMSDDEQGRVIAALRAILG